MMCNLGMQPVLRRPILPRWSLQVSLEGCGTGLQALMQREWEAQRCRWRYRVRKLQVKQL